MPRPAVVAAVAAVVLAGTTAPAARAWRLDWEGGLSAATGEYASSERTTTGWLANGIALHTGPFVLRGSIPVIVQNSRTAISGNGLPLPGRRGSSGATVADTNRVGQGRDSTGAPIFMLDSTDDDWRIEPGDPVVSLGVELPDRDWIAGLSGGAKVPATGTGGFGTGEWDGWAAATVGRRLSSTTTLRASAGYGWYGDPVGFELEDGWTGAVRWAREDPDGGLIAAYVHGGASPLAGFDPPLSFGIAVRRPWSTGRGAATLSVSVGLTETAAQVLGGIGWTWRLDRD